MSYVRGKPAINERFQKSFVKAAAQKQNKVFKGKEREKQFMPKGNERYYYFTLKHFAQLGIIDYEMISKLRKGAKMLSIGIGLATMEKALLAFSIPPENIDIADIEIHPLAERTPFRKFVFDMTEPTAWPGFGRKYDYIVFPESLGVATLTWSLGHFGFEKKEGAQKYSAIYYELIDRILSGKSSKVANTVFLTSFAGLLPHAEKTVEVLITALRHLNKRGEIRINGHGLKPVELAYLILSISKIAKIYVFNKQRIIIKKK